VEREVAKEVLYTGLIGTVLTFPLRYYLMAHHIDKPTRNTVVLTAWGLVLGYVLFEHSRCRLQERQVFQQDSPMVY